MSAPLVLAVPSKGRLQQNAEAFFARAGLELVKPRGARDYRGGIRRIDGVEVAFLSASEITEQLAAGAVHFGITGEDLVRETIYRRDGDRPLEIPAGAVVVPGARAAPGAAAARWGISLYAPVIVKYRDAKTDAATALEEYLR